MVASMSDKLKSTWNSASPAPTNPSAPRTPGATTLACVSLNWPTDTAVDFATFGKNADGSVNQASVQEFTGIVSGNNLTSVVLTSGGADQGNNITEFVVMKPTSKGHQDLVDAVRVAHNQDGTLKDEIVTTAKIAQSAKDAIGSYSTSEVATPYKWVDGKTIYRKTVDCGALPNNTTKTVAHGVTGITHVIKISGAAGLADNSTFITLPYIEGSAASAYNTDVRVTQSAVTLKNTADMSSFSKSFVTIEYVKS